MSDIGETSRTGNLDRDAVAHLARRMRLDANLAYQIGFGTESFERIVAAEAAAAGCSVDEMKRQLLHCADRHPAQIPALRQRIEELEEEVTMLRRRLDPLAARQLPLFGDAEGAR